MDKSCSFELELERLLPRLRRFAHALSRSRADADDLVQSSVERAVRAKSQWRLGTRLDSWLYTIVRNQWIDMVRARLRRQRHEVPLDEARHEAETQSCSIDTQVELKRMMAAMQRLPDEQREVVSLILIEGFGYRETGEMLGIPIGTVASRLVRGRNALLELTGATRERVGASNETG